MVYYTNFQNMLLALSAPGAVFGARSEIQKRQKLKRIHIFPLNLAWTEVKAGHELNNARVKQALKITWKMRTLTFRVMRQGWFQHIPRTLLMSVPTQPLELLKLKKRGHILLPMLKIT